MADRLKLSNGRLERTYTYHTSFISPCLKPPAQVFSLSTASPQLKHNPLVFLSCYFSSTTTRPFHSKDDILSERKRHHLVFLMSYCCFRPCVGSETVISRSGSDFEGNSGSDFTGISGDGILGPLSYPWFGGSQTVFALSGAKPGFAP